MIRAWKREIIRLFGSGYYYDDKIVYLSINNTYKKILFNQLYIPMFLNLIVFNGTLLKCATTDFICELRLWSVFKEWLYWFGKVRCDDPKISTFYETNSIKKGRTSKHEYTFIIIVIMRKINFSYVDIKCLRLCVTLQITSGFTKDA